MSAWDACTMEPNHWLKWIECHPSLAGYIQAIGVTATLAAALLGPPLARWIRFIRERHARHRATVSLAHALLPFVNAMMERIDGRLETLGTYDEPHGDELRLFLQNMGIQIPGQLDGFYLHDDVDGARLLFIVQLVNAARGYNMALADKQRDGVAEDQWTALQIETREALVKLKEQTLDASAQIREM